MDKKINLIIEKLKKIPYCEGIIYAGSRIEGDFTATSDYDFTVLIGRGKSYYKRFYYKNLLVDICSVTAEIIEKQDFKRDEVSNAELFIIAYGKIVFDKSGHNTEFLLSHDIKIVVPFSDTDDWFFLFDIEHRNSIVCQQIQTMKN